MIDGYNAEACRLAHKALDKALAENHEYIGDVDNRAAEAAKAVEQRAIASAAAVAQSAKEAAGDVKDALKTSNGRNYAILTFIILLLAALFWRQYDAHGLIVETRQMVKDLPGQLRASGVMLSQATPQPVAPPAAPSVVESSSVSRLSAVLPFVAKAASPKKKPPSK